MTQIIKLSKNPEETFKIAYDLAVKVDKPLLIGLTGELGTGKTIFAKGFAEGFGVKELVTSPTFLGISEYYSGLLPFIHMDFFKKIATKESIQSYLEKSVVLIEWIENFNDVFKDKLKPDIFVYIQYLNNSERQITIDF